VPVAAAQVIRVIEVAGAAWILSSSGAQVGGPVPSAGSLGALLAYVLLRLAPEPLVAPAAGQVRPRRLSPQRIRCGARPRHCNSTPCGSAGLRRSVWIPADRWAEFRLFPGSADAGVFSTVACLGLGVDATDGLTDRGDAEIAVAEKAQFPNDGAEHTDAVTAAGHQVVGLHPYYEASRLRAGFQGSGHGLETSKRRSVPCWPRPSRRAGPAFHRQDLPGFLAAKVEPTFVVAVRVRGHKRDHAGFGQLDPHPFRSTDVFGPVRANLRIQLPPGHPYLLFQAMQKTVAGLKAFVAEQPDLNRAGSHDRQASR
jgi:hypothetical protein